MTATWRPVPGWESYYEVSDDGQVASVDRFLLIGRALKGRILRPFPHPQHGHMQVTLCRDGQRWSTTVHRLVLLAFVGPAPVGQEGCHNNGIPSDNRLDNLRWDTDEANARDAVVHGAHASVKKTHCPAGHPYSPENTYIDPTVGSRACRTCRAAHSRRWHADRRAAVA